MIRLADYVICVVEEMKHRYVNFGISTDNIFVLENTLNHNSFQKIPVVKPEDGTVTLFYS